MFLWSWMSQIKCVRAKQIIRTDKIFKTLICWSYCNHNISHSGFCLQIYYYIFQIFHIMRICYFKSFSCNYRFFSFITTTWREIVNFRFFIRKNRAIDIHYLTTSIHLQFNTSTTTWPRITISIVQYICDYKMRTNSYTSIRFINRNIIFTINSPNKINIYDINGHRTMKITGTCFILTKVKQFIIFLIHLHSHINRFP